MIYVVSCGTWAPSTEYEKIRTQQRPEAQGQSVMHSGSTGSSLRQLGGTKLKMLNRGMPRYVRRQSA